MFQHFRLHFKSTVANLLRLRDNFLTILNLLTDGHSVCTVSPLTSQTARSLFIKVSTKNECVYTVPCQKFKYHFTPFEDYHIKYSMLKTLKIAVIKDTELFKKTNICV